MGDVKLNNLIRKKIIDLFQSVQSDPDYGLELSENVKKRLRKPSGRLIPFGEIKRKHR